MPLMPPKTEYRPVGYKPFFVLNSIEHIISTTKISTNEECLALGLSDVVFIMLINVKMPTIVMLINVEMTTIVGILTFISRINFVLS